MKHRVVSGGENKHNVAIPPDTDVSKEIAEGTYKLCRERFGFSDKKARQWAKRSERAWRPSKHAGL